MLLLCFCEKTIKTINKPFIERSDNTVTYEQKMKCQTINIMVARERERERERENSSVRVMGRLYFIQINEINVYTCMIQI